MLCIQMYVLGVVTVAIKNFPRRGLLSELVKGHVEAYKVVQKYLAPIRCKAYPFGIISLD